MRHSLLTKALHALLALSIVHQLLISLVMVVPRPPSRPLTTPFTLHAWVGVASFAVVLAFWLWSVVRRGEAGIGALLPWFSAACRQAVVADIKAYVAALSRLEMPDTAAHSAFASAVHGLGLLLATYLAGTGVIIYLQMGADGSMGRFAHLVADWHGALANLMWAYLIGHGAVALLHQFFGEGVLRRMWTISG